MDNLLGIRHVGRVMIMDCSAEVGIIRKVMLDCSWRVMVG